MEKHLHWLENISAGPVPVTWGCAWEKGALQPQAQVRLQSSTTEHIPLQTRVTATWPDGSVKWTAHSAVADTGTTGFVLSQGETDTVADALCVQETDTVIRVISGSRCWNFGKNGNPLLVSAMENQQLLYGNGTLTALLEQTVPQGDGNWTRRLPMTVSDCLLEVENQGPVRVCLKAEAVLRAVEGPELPVTVRFYLYAGTPQVRVVHTMLWAGNPGGERLAGLGMSFDLPVTGAMHNRHVRFSGDDGFFTEAARLLCMRRNFDQSETYRTQLSQRRVDIPSDTYPAMAAMVEDLAVWNHFFVSQLSDQHFEISKQTSSDCCRVSAHKGSRSRGLAYAGSESGGLALGIRHFAEKAPRRLDVDNLGENTARMTAWFYSPDAPAADLRHYDTKTHVDAAYEGFHELRSTPVGIGNTNELMLWGTPGLVDNQTLRTMETVLCHPPLLVMTPEAYHSCGALGVWSLPCTDTPDEAELEHALEDLLNFYLAEVRQRRWYGFWDFGDVCHTYDTDRHTWRYDLGGFAWANNELVPNMWLWTSFLRTGRADVFRMAEAMTRHTSEVDVYHLGEYKGLGSRHNVVHWGCGCKEARISMAGLHRAFYYLTGDERTGDLMDEACLGEEATARLDPMRDYFPKDDYAAHIRSGPDWSAFSSNWMTRWERFGDTRARDMLLKGVESLKKMPFRLGSGTTFGYYPGEGVLHYLGDNNYDYHMIIAFGAPEVWMELSGLLEDAQWDDMLAEFGEMYAMTDDEMLSYTGGVMNKAKWHWPMFAVRMMAWGAAVRQKPELERKAWDILKGDLEKFMKNGRLHIPVVGHEAVPCPVSEIPDISTNWASQWSLNAIESLALLKKNHGHQRS